MWEGVSVTFEVPGWVVAVVVAASIAQAVATAWLHLTTLGLREVYHQEMDAVRADVDKLARATQDDSESDTSGGPVARAHQTAASPSIVINVNRGDAPASGVGVPAPTPGSDGRRTRVISPSVLLMSPAPSRPFRPMGGGGILQRGSPLREEDGAGDSD